VLKSHYAIANFSKILGTSIHDRSRLSGEQFTQRGMGATFWPGMLVARARPPSYGGNSIPHYFHNLCNRK
jgi:hypothetical protein